MAVDPVIRQALDLRDQHILPAAESMRCDLAPSLSMDHPPMVLLLGNHSSGKSSLINHLVDRDIQRTGVAPVDDGFTVLMHAERERTLDGATLTGSPELPFTDLKDFGDGLVQHLGARSLPVDLLDHLWLVDSPGMIDSASADAERPYDFTGVVRWFAERADLVLLFFDPEKPGTTGETLAVLNESLTGIDHKLRIVMNKMDLFDGVRDFARTYGALCWNLSRCLQTKDMPHIFTTVIPGLVREECRLPLEGFAAALLELESTIAELPERRRDSIINQLSDEARGLYLRSRVVRTLRRQVSRRWLTAIAALVLLGALGCLATWYAWMTHTWPVALGITAIPVVCFALIGWLPGLAARISEGRGIRNLDQVFATAFHEELARREHTTGLEQAWQRNRLPLLRALETSGLAGLKRIDRRRERALGRIAEQDLPALRKA